DTETVRYCRDDDHRDITYREKEEAEAKKLAKKTHCECCYHCYLGMGSLLLLPCSLPPHPYVHPSPVSASGRPPGHSTSRAKQEGGGGGKVTEDKHTHSTLIPSS